MLFKFLNREENVIALDMFEVTRKNVGLVIGLPPKFMAGDTMVEPKDYISYPSRATVATYSDIESNESLYDFLHYRYESSKRELKRRYEDCSNEELQVAEVDLINTREALTQYMIELDGGYYGNYNDMFMLALEQLFKPEKSSEPPSVFLNFVKTLVQARLLSESFVPHHHHTTAVDLLMFISIPAHGTEFGSFFSVTEPYKEYKLKNVLRLFPQALLELFEHCMSLVKERVHTELHTYGNKSPYFGMFFNECIATYYYWDRNQTESVSANDYYAEFCNRNNPDMDDEDDDEEDEFEQDHNPFIDEDEDKRYED